MVEFDWIFVKSLLRLCSYFRAFRYRIGQAAAAYTTSLQCSAATYEPEVRCEYEEMEEFNDITLSTVVALYFCF